MPVTNFTPKKSPIVSAILEPWNTWYLNPPGKLKFFSLFFGFSGQQRWQIVVRSNVNWKRNATITRTIGTTGPANAASTLATDAGAWAIDKRNECSHWSSGMFHWSHLNCWQDYNFAKCSRYLSIGPNSTVAATKPRIIGTFGLLGWIQREWTHWPNISQHWIGTTGNISRPNPTEQLKPFLFVELMQCFYVFSVLLPKLDLKSFRHARYAQTIHTL